MSGVMTVHITYCTIVTQDALSNILTTLRQRDAKTYNLLG